MTLKELIELLELYPNKNERVRLWSTGNDGGRVTVYPEGQHTKDIIVNEPDVNGVSRWSLDK